jgi:autoinducer 2-degrading protein
VFALFVRLRVEPSQRDRFLSAITANATASVRDEPGCLRFDVSREHADPDSYLLYEVYEDEQAFEAHRGTPHYAAWRALSTDLLVTGSQHNTIASLVHSAERVR